MNKESLEKELQSYLEKANNLKADLLRIEGILLFLQDKIKQLQNRIKNKCVLEIRNAKSGCSIAPVL